MGNVRGFPLWMLVLCVVAFGSCKEEPPSPQEPDVRDSSLPDPVARAEPRGEPAGPPEKPKETAADKPLACKRGNPVRPQGAFFTDISRQSGIQVQGILRSFTKKVPINDHSRLAFADINGDGYDDIIAHSLYPNAQAGIPFEHRIYLNNGDGTFKHFSDESGLRKVQAGFFAFADIDNDGDQDLFAGLDVPLGNHTSQIYLNDGKGRFTLKPNSGVEIRNMFAANAVFGDFDNDGKLDLFVGAGGTSYRAKDYFFLGNGDGTFRNQSHRLAGNQTLVTNGSVTCDYDNDGDLDIVVSTYGVSNLLGVNVLWENQEGKGFFKNVARAKGFEALPGGNYYLASTGNGSTPEPGKQPGQYVGSNGFGVDCKDVNNDGRYDIFLTAISHPNEGTYSRKWSDPTQLLINLGAAKQFAFQNEFLKRKLPFNEGDVDGALHDFDNDGRLDISISRDNKYEKSYTNVAQKAWFGLYRQLADGSFQSLGTTSGINTLDPKNSTELDACTGDTCAAGEKCLLARCRKPCTQHSDCTTDEVCGAYWDSGKILQFCRSNVKMKGAQNHAWADIDRDGDLDLLVGGRDKGGGRPNFLFRNDIGSKNPWLAFKLIGDGVKVNRDAIGARLSLKFKDQILSREVQSSRGMYNSIDTRTLHFGLADLDCSYTIELRWPNGEKYEIKRDQIKESSYITITYPNTVK